MCLYKNFKSSRKEPNHFLTNNFLRTFHKQLDNKMCSKHKNFYRVGTTCNKLLVTPLIYCIILQLLSTTTNAVSSSATANHLMSSGSIVGDSSSSSSRDSSSGGGSNVGIANANNGLQCQRITVPACQGLGYNMTAMPNLAGHSNQLEAELRVGNQ